MLGDPPPNALEASLASAAREWLAELGRQEGSKTNSFRRQYLVAVAAHLADRLDRPVPETAGAKDRLELQFGRLIYQDLLRPELLDAVADYTAGHAPKSVHNMLATWRRFARHLVASGLLASNPFDTGADHKPRRWIPEALRYAELERIAAAAASADPRARDPWPERDVALFAVLAGAGLNSGAAITMPVSTIEDTECPPSLRLLSRHNQPQVIPVVPRVITTIGHYLRTRTERIGPYAPSDALFVRRLAGQYRPFSAAALHELVISWYRRAAVTVPANFPPAQALAYTYATLLVDAGGSVPELERLLGGSPLPPG